MYLKEGVLRDVLDAIDMVKDVKDTGLDDTLFDAIAKGKKYNSISAKTRELVATFPVICTDTLSPSTAMIISKAIERKCTNMLQLIFASMSISDGGEFSDSVQDTLKRHHNNLNMKFASVDDIYHAMEIMEEKTNINNYVNWNNVKKLNEGAIKCKEDKGMELPTSLTEYRIDRSSSGEKTVICTEADSRDYKSRALAAYETQFKRAEAKENYLQKQLLSTDVKKANELVPSMLVVKYYQKTGDMPVQRVAVVGVKARMIAINSFEIIDKIHSKNEDNKGLLKLIRATTKETKFCKDFLFAIDKAKIDALSRSRRGSVSPIWKTLERRAIKQKLRKILGGSNDASPISTLVITQNEVDYLKKHHNVYIDKVQVVGQILDAYNLMCLVIVDESTEVAKFLFDGDIDVWENLSFTSLEREATDASYKKIINLMNRMV